MYCQNCGKQNPDNAAFCSGCGQRLAPCPDGPASNNAAQGPSAGPVPTGSPALPCADGPGPNGAGGEAPGASNAGEFLTALREKYEANPKLFWMIGAGILVLIIVCTAIAGSIESGKYVEMAKSVFAFDDGGVTMDEVFSYCLDSPSWSASRKGDTAEVDISGRLRGTSSDFRTKMVLQLIDNGDDWESASFSSLSVGGRSLPNDSEMMQSVNNMALACARNWDSLAPYAQAFSTSYGNWTGNTWEMAVYSQKADAAEYVLYEVSDTIYSGLSNLLQLADADTMASAINGTMDSIDSMFETTAPGTTLDEMMEALRLTLGFLGMLFAFAG